ncbi:DUF5103 domain-containing protein [Parabacteroides sp. FAFU027]|uniref:type IX secretion system plug protein n=1 Tax=Parabacteroides sp. FAFU027 TaxID=2922715 RepID=UPI001FB02E88|nr:DUF5103 domain-containing protein [Parabacteroides sp. FAFU027]
MNNFFSRVKLPLFASLLFANLSLILAQNQAVNPKVSTFTVRSNDNWLNPTIIELNGTDKINIDFDFLDQNAHYFYYSVIHCNADWTPSELSESEYLDGFNNQPIEDHKTSFNTYLNYTHYHLQIPNDNVKLKKSGNYLVKIYEDNNPENVIAIAAISVFEKQVNIYPTIKTITDIDYNKGHQQIDLRIDTRNYSIRSPQMEMKIVVTQNNRIDNQVILNAPTTTNSTGFLFEHCPSLIFEAGNEYRRFEMITHRYPGMNVEKIRYFDPLYHAFLYQDKSRANKSYIFDKDQNGRYFIRNSEVTNYDYETDYFIAHFSLKADSPFGNGKLYLLGEFNQNRIDPEWEVPYDISNRQYSREKMLKQGAYNYLYIYVPDDNKRGSLTPAEGDYFETENEYTIRLYHRGPGERYDRLIGYSFIQSNQSN